MKIGIIGAGQIGGTLARRFSELGHQVSVANAHGPESLAGLARQTGAKPVSSREAARSGDVIIVTIPEGKVPDLPKDLFDGVSSEVVVVDTGNYYPQHRDGRIAEIENGMIESRWVSRQLHRPVVKAFNNIDAGHLGAKGRPSGTPGRIALPVAGDYAHAKQVVLHLLDELGFDGVDAGGLDDSWRQQPGTPVYSTDFDTQGVRRGLSEARRERQPQFRATPHSPGTFAHPS